jgi:GNAT superfamily N-acetyltransferase
LDYVVRPYRPGDEVQIVPLLQLVFYGWQDLDFWRWKYQDNPQKKAIMIVTEIDGRIIGFTSSIFKMVKVGDKIYFSAYGTDLAVHPDFRRKGVRTNMAVLKREMRSKYEEHFNYSFTENPLIINHPSKHGNRNYSPYFLRRFFRIQDLNLHNRMKPAKNTSEQIRRIGFNAIRQLSDLKNSLTSSPPPNSDIQTTEIDEFDDRTETFWNQVKDHYDFIVERSREHLNWNYCDPRGGNFKVFLAEEDEHMLGYVVLKMGNGGEYPRGEVMDLLTIPGRMDAAMTLLTEAIKDFNNNGINFCSTMLLEGHPYEKVFEKHGFTNGRAKVNVHYSCFNMDDESVNLIKKIINAADVENMHLVPGDLL